MSSTIGFGNDEIKRAELDAPAVSIVKGMTFLLVQLPSLAHLALVISTAPASDLSLPGLLDHGPWNTGFVGRYCYVPTDRNTDGTITSVQTRMVSHGMEDPATGSAACALAGYLALQNVDSLAAGTAASLLRCNIVQGVELGRRSVITVEVQAKTDGTGGLETVFLVVQQSK